MKIDFYVNVDISPRIQEYLLKDFLENGCFWIKFREALCNMDKKTRKSMKMTILYDALTYFALTQIIYLQINFP